MFQPQSRWNQQKYLEAIDSQASARLFSPALQLGDDAVVDVLFLLLQEMRRDGVERVAGELVLSGDCRQHIELHPAINGDILVISRSVCLAAEGGVLHDRLAASRAPPQPCCALVAIVSTMMRSSRHCDVLRAAKSTESASVLVLIKTKGMEAIQNALEQTLPKNILLVV